MVSAARLARRRRWASQRWTSGEARVVPLVSSFVLGRPDRLPTLLRCGGGAHGSLFRSVPRGFRRCRPRRVTHVLPSVGHLDELG